MRHNKVTLVHTILGRDQLISTQVFSSRREACDSIVKEYSKGSDSHEALRDFVEDSRISSIKIRSHKVETVTVK